MGFTDRGEIDPVQSDPVNTKVKDPSGRIVVWLFAPVLPFLAMTKRKGAKERVYSTET